MGHVEVIGDAVGEVFTGDEVLQTVHGLSLIHISEPTRLLSISYAVSYLGIDIRPGAMNITWDDMFAAMHGLKDFVTSESLAYGIANDFTVTDAFLTDAHEKIEGAFTA